MIDTVNHSYHVQVKGTTSYPYVPANVNNPMQGMLRFQDGSLQVFDGSIWATMSIRLTTDVSPGFNEVMIWAQTRMAQEKRWVELAEQHPAVADALAARDRAEQALSVVSRLCGELEQ
jgi:hypothetical protein